MNDEQTPPAPLNSVSHLLIQLSRIFAAVPQTSEDERSAYIRALVEMARFVREAARSTQDTGLWNAQSRLSDLAYALQDLDAGRVAPVLQRTKRKGTSPDSSLSWMRRARVLVAMNALQRADPDLKGLRAAARHIAEKYPGLRRLMTRGKDLPGTILHWRRELEEAKPDTFLRQFSEQMVDMENFGAELSQGRPDLLRNYAYNTLAPYLT
jgi:hypothetical protein